jgi:diguanylate cyclase (GGDEF)-like protein
VRLADALEVGEDWADSAAIVGLVQDRAGRLWMAWPEGVAVRERDSRWRWVAGRRGEGTPLPAGDIYNLWPAGNDRLWIGMSSGLVRFDPAAGEIDLRLGTSSDADIRLHHNNVLALTEVSEEGTLWLGTVVGLHRVRHSTGEVQLYSRSDGLASDIIYSVARDAAGQIWVATAQGLGRLSPASGEIQTFDSRDGLQSNEFNQNSVAVLDDGRLAFGGINGLNLFNPARLRVTAPPPRVAVTGFYLFNEEMHFDQGLDRAEQVRLTHRENVISLEFAALDFNAPSKNQFEYMLAGFDRQWNAAGTHNRATYTKLPPGSYVFRVRGASSLGNWSREEATLAIEVLPPIWRTWWAYTLYGFAAAGLVLTSWSLIMRRRRREEAFRRELDRRHWAENLHRLTTRLANSLDAGTIMDRLHDNLGGMVRVQTIAIFRAENGAFQCIGVRGPAAHDSEVILTPTRLVESVRRCRETGAAIALEAGELTALGMGGVPGLNGVMVPLSLAGVGFGLLVAIREGDEFGGQERELLGAAGTQALVSLEKARLFAKVEQLATIDDLTGLNNRRHFESLASRELERSTRYGHPVALLLMDVDHFKRVNDRYGHEGGDDCLCRISRVLEQAMRRSDLLARYGGEEFIALLPETPLPEAQDAAERLRKAVEGEPVSVQEGAPMCSISIGLAVIEKGGMDLDGLVRVADQALYAAKHQGRNRVVVADLDKGRLAGTSGDM